MSVKVGYCSVNQHLRIRNKTLTELHNKRIKFNLKPR